jgi:uncharacterized protein (DUF1501 family)
MRTRRAFLKTSGLALFGAGAAPLWLRRAAGQSAARKKTLVAVFLRGAADGLNVVAPHGDKLYRKLRPALALEKPLDLDGYFGFHPALAPLLPLWEQKRLAVVHAAGSPDPTRSHFDAQDFMESGTPGLKSTRDGWLNRALAPGANAGLRAVSATVNLPRTMRGAVPAVAVSRLEEFKADPAFARDYPGVFDVVKIVQSAARQTPVASAYPSGPLGRSLGEIARLIKAGVGLEAAFAELGGWDHHVNEAPQLEAKLKELGAALAAFHADLADRMDDVTVVTMSEFGRTAAENGNGGTDHGHGGFMFVLGGGVAGGKVLGRWPGLDRDQLYEGRDLAVTTDFRDVLAPLLERQWGAPSIARAFPGHAGANRVL